MSQSPRKLISKFTANKGVEAREVQNEVDNSSSVQYTRADVESSGDSERRACAAASDDSPSLIQVVVHKQRRPPGPAAATAQPLPPHTASTPLTVEAASALLGCPAFTALQRQLWDKVQTLDYRCMSRGAEPGAADVNDEKYSWSTGVRGQKTLKKSIWQKVSRLKSQDVDFGKEMDRIEVYQFERGAALVCARRPVSISRVERAALRLARPATVLLDELLGTLRVFVMMPVHVALHLEQCVAASVQEAVGGALAGASNALLKPLLALVFNALMRPPLLLMGAACSALREAAHPIALLVGDALEAAARPLAALRLVHVERGGGCACACRATQRV